MSGNCHTSASKSTRPSWRVFALFPLIAGCGINPSKQIATPTTKNFSGMSCEQLGLEKQRIEQGYIHIRFASHHGTKEEIRALNGETHAVNDAIRINSCKLADIQIPGAGITESKAGK